MADQFSDAALLLAAHGSTVNPDSAAAALQHAQALRERGLFAEVQVAFWKQAPFLRDVAKSLAARPAQNIRRVFVAPLFLSDGYFTQQIIPREAGLLKENEDIFDRAQNRGAVRWFFCHPFGTHPRMTDLILSRAAEVLNDSGAQPPAAETALFLAAHGTERNAQSRAAADWQVRQIAATHQFAETLAVFMEEEPRISRYPTLTHLPNIVVVPFFISDGLHAREDVPVLLGEPPELVQDRLRHGQPTWRNPTERAGKRIWYATSIGTSPLVPEVILERVREASTW